MCKAAVAMLFGTGMNITLQLLLVPILILSWGVDLYGEWLLVYTIPAYLVIADFGVSTVSINRVQNLFKKQLISDASCAFYAALLIITLVLTICLLMAVGSVYIFETKLVEFFAGLGFDIIYLIPLLILDSFSTMYMNCLSGLFRLDGRYHVTINIQNITRVVSIMIMGVIAYLGGSPLEAVCAGLLFKLIAFVYLYLIVRGKYLMTLKYTGGLNFVYLKKLISESSSFLLLPVSNALYLNVSIMIITIVFTTQLLVVYSTIRTMTRFSSQLLGIIGKSWWSEIADFYANFDKDKLRWVFKMIFSLTLICVICGFTLLYIFGEKIYSIWLGSKVEFDSMMFIYLLIGALLAGFWSSLEVFLLATNLHNNYAKVFFMANIMHLVLGYLLSMYGFVYGLPIAGIISGSLICLYLLYDINKNILVFNPPTLITNKKKSNSGTMLP
jgi:O-antigen/teichoic acid export membrane protein